MKATSILTLVGAALVATSCGGGAGPLSDEDRAAIQSTVDTYVQTTLAADWTTWSELWADDAVNMPPNEAALVGLPAIMEWMEAFPEVTAFTSTPSEISGAGDVAYVRGVYEYTATVEGESVTDSGKYLVVMRKDADGSWKTTSQIWNSDLPLPQGS